MFRTKALTATAVLLVAALTGCTAQAPDPDAETGPASGTLRLTAVSSPVTLDPAGAEWGNRSPYFEAVFDTLVRIRADGAIEPWLATEWSYDDSGTTLSLTLRDDVEFSDGSPLTADVVVQNLERFRDGTAANAALLSGVIDIRATADAAVDIVLDKPNPALLTYLGRDAGVIGSAESFDDEDLATNPVGSGPYIFDAAKTVIGSTYAYQRNPEYWNPEAQHYDELIITVMPDPTAAMNAIKAGEANGVKLVSNTQRAEAESAGWAIAASKVDVQGLYLFDRAGTLTEPLGDVRVRQALNHAIDRQGLIDAVLLGHGTPTTQVFPPSGDAFEASLDERYPYDPEKARELLADAGYPDGLTLQLPMSTALGTTIFTVVEQQLAEVGVIVEFVDVPVTNLISDLLGAKFSASYFALESVDDWWVIESMVAPTAVWNPFRYEDPDATALIDGVREGQDGAALELNEYLVEEAWFAPFYRAEGAYAVDAKTTVTPMASNTYPSIYDFAPKS